MADPIREIWTNSRIFGTAEREPPSDPASRVSMSPSSADVAQTPEPKSTSGLASVFKSLTGSKSTRSPHPQSPVPSLTSQFGAHSLKKAIYGGPPNYEQLHEQLKAGNPLSERLAAAESLRHAVQDYPLSGVTSIFKEGKDLIEPSKPLEARVAGYELLTACVQKSTSTDPERMLYFRVLTADAHPEDFHLQLAAIVELAKHGRDLSGFHYQAIPLLTAWLRQAFTITSAARKKASKVNRSQKIPLGEETNLSLLFVFIVDVIKFSFNIAEDGDTSDLMDAILYICVHTPLSSDLKACINVIDAIITYGEIPNDKLLECVKVLCSIHCLVADARSEAWRSISNLAKSHNGQITVRYLLDILRNPSTHGDNEKQTIREIRGAMSVLEKLFAKDGQNGYPLVPFTLLMDALTKAVAVEHAKVEADILHLILSLLNGDGEEVMENVIEEDWFVMFDVVLKCSRRTRENSKGRSLNNRSRILSPLTNEGTSDETFSSSVAQTLETLIIRIEQLLQASSGKEFFQRDDCITFFVSVHPFLTESCAKLVIDYYMEYRLCYPSDLEWRDNIKLIMGAFFSDRTQPAHIRLHSLQAVTDVYEVVELMDEPEDPDCVQTLVTLILEDIGDEKDIAVLQELVYFAVSVAEKAEESLFSYIVNAFRRTVTSDRLQSPLGSPQGPRQGIMGTNRPSSSIASNSLAQTPSNVVTKGLVHIFMKTMDSSASKSIRIFDELLWIAKSHECETDARISALKMLFRLRADWANRLFLTPFTESDGLAASLFRTPPSLARKQAADEAAQQQHRSSRVDDMSGSRISRSTSFGGQGYPQGRAPFRTGTGVSRIVQKNHQMWMSPDPDALPEPASNKASSLLCSFAGADEDYPDGLITLTRIPLNIALFLETIIALLQHGCDWEIYSYILVHLASQLTNKALFKAAMPQIKELRVLLCDQIKNSSYHEPPLSSGLRKADVAICMFQILTMIISYHDVFTKAEDDEIVRTFLQGVGADRAAKCCVHALSICCHELPASTSKALVNILQRMSSIITQSHVAVHILEFLACLARLPNLYVNFREDEYKTILMMCFRYLQYVRDQPTKEPGARNSAQARNSGVSMDGLNNLVDLSAAESNFQPNTSDDLPQYVHALAYHVIIFWFLSLRLPDRAGLVGWITKNLISTDVNGKEMIDEQAQVTLDFMQRVAYADVDESAADPTFTEERFGEILKKRWIVGQSIVTVEQATKGGWAQITKRQPSGTSCYIIREKFTRPPAHQDQLPANSDINVVFPSHLLLQLTASMPQSNEASRPIPLPNDAQMTRAIATFDRNFTVDGHKVGVIYIGANQTQEVEILSNVMGSSDYTHFLSGLGTLTKLKGANFNTQGLDRYSDSDGEYAFCWRDRVTEIVFHVTTQMPTNLSNDPQCIGKKRHIGNDFVNIIFNNSGLPFRYDTFPSEFNYVNIVITPESRASFVATRLRSEAQMKNAFYKVQVMSKPGFPEISPASETKMVGLEALPGFIRLLALNASVFSLVWANREGGEHISSWRNRLREIKRLREKYGPKKPNSNPTSPVAPTIYDTKTIRDSLNGLRRSSVANFLINPTESTSQRSSIFSTAETEVGAVGAEESLVDGLDFSKWA